jgi:hypothetical protein
MQFPKDQRIVIGLGAAVALAAALALGFAFSKKPKGQAAPPASQGGLQVSVNEAPALDSKRQLRCFVDGQFVGMATLAECAKKNGVSAQSLDVGLDESGNPTAAPTASLAPPPALPPVTAEPAPGAEPTAPSESATTTAPAPVGPAAACLKFEGGEWRRLSESTGQNACVRALFAGRCVRPGDAVYGRWGETTLRLVPGRVETSSDNNHFRTLVKQNPGCDIPQIR